MNIAPWGMPYTWRPVTYVVGNYVCKTCSSLLPLLLWLKSSNEFRSAELDTVVIVLDSIIDWGRGVSKSREREARNPCRTCFERFAEYLNIAESAKNYGELKQHVEEFVKRFVFCLSEQLVCTSVGEEMRVLLQDVLERLQVIVAPAIGRPGGLWVFRGKLHDYEVAVLRGLGELIISKPYRTLVVDLTHGINFMPSLTTRLVPRIASILLAAHSSLNSVEVRLYNSDPIPPQASEDTVININEAVHSQVKTIELVHALSEKPIYTSSNEFEEGVIRFKELEEVRGRALSALRYIYSALYYPLPLALYSFLCNMCSDVEEFRKADEYVAKAVRIVREEREDGSPRCEVVKPLTIDPDTYYVYWLVKALCYRVKCEEGEPTLEYLKGVVVLIYRLIHEAHVELIWQELSRFEREIKDIMSTPKYQQLKGEWVPYPELKEERDSDRQMDRRIMIAHAGLQKDFIEVYIDEKPKVRYKLSLRELREELRNVCLVIPGEQMHQKRCYHQA